MPNLHPRTCRKCGAVFDGGPRAWFCPTCRDERRRITSRDGKRRERAGETRLIGSKDTCQICGKEYVVMSGKQKYCPTCAPEAVAEIDRTQGLIYYTANSETINPARNEKRRKQRADAKRSPREKGVETMDSQKNKSTRGGARPGAGRPARPTERKLVRLTPEESAAVESYALADGVSVHAWMVSAIRAALQTRADGR